MLEVNILLMLWNVTKCLPFFSRHRLSEARRDAELAGRDGVYCRQVCNWEPRPVGIVCIRRIVGKDFRIALGYEDIRGARVRGDAWLVHGKHAMVGGWIWVGVGVGWGRGLGSRLGSGSGLGWGVGSVACVVVMGADEIAGRVSPACCQLEA
jgi:hypothetical protein